MLCCRRCSSSSSTGSAMMAQLVPLHLLSARLQRLGLPTLQQIPHRAGRMEAAQTSVQAQARASFTLWPLTQALTQATCTAPAPALAQAQALILRARAGGTAGSSSLAPLSSSALHRPRRHRATRSSPCQLRALSGLQRNPGASPGAPLPTRRLQRRATCGRGACSRAGDGSEIAIVAATAAATAAAAARPPH